MPDGVDWDDLVRSVSYVGSAEHKSYPSPAGHPMLRSDATPCDHSLGTFEDFERWLREGLMSMRIGAPWEGERRILYRQMGWK